MEKELANHTKKIYETVKDPRHGFWHKLNLYKNKAMDTASNKLIADHLDFAARSTHANIGRYEGFKSSGKIGTIEDDSLKQAILVYYQQTMPGLDDEEGTANSFQLRILDLEANKGDETPFREFARSFKMQFLLQIATENIEGVISDYDSAQMQAGKIIAMIGPQ